MSKTTPNLQPITNNKQTVLIVLDLPARGGAETQATYLAKGLVEKGMDVHILFFIPGETEELERFRETGAVVHYTGFRSKLIIPPFKGLESKARALYYQIQLILQLRKIKPDSIIPFTYPPNIILSRSWKWTKAKKCFWNQRDEGRMFHGTTKEKRALENVTSIISNSIEGALFLEKYTNRKISIIHNGVDLPDFKKAKLTSKIRVVMIANFSSYKNHIELLKSWKIVSASYAKNSIELVLIGRDGNASKVIKEFIITNQLNDSVSCIGMITNVSEFLVSSDIGVFSSLKEGLPNGILECMAAGLPVIATKINGAVEALGRDYPFLVGPGDIETFANMLFQLIEDSKLREKIGKQNRVRVEEHFQMEQMVSKYVRLIN